MEYEEIIRWVRESVEPIPDLCQRNAYRCAAYLKDDLYLPCVLFREAEAHTQLALARFDGSRGQVGGTHDPNSYSSIVQTFVAKGNRVSIWDMERVEVSPFAISPSRLREVKGETRMSWTAFAAVMDDGREFSFGTSYGTEFFSMPQGYSADRISKIIPHRNETTPVYRERPFFECLIELVDFGAA